MAASTDYTEYERDDPGGKLAAEMATDPNLAVIIHVKRDGTVTVNNLTGRPFQEVSGPVTLPQQLPDGSQVRAGYVISTRNPTCVWCQHGGAWRQVCT